MVPLLGIVEDVDGCAKLGALVLLDLAAVDEGLKVGIGIGSRVELAGALLEVRNELRSVFDVRDGAAGGAGDTADESLGAAVGEHTTDGGVVRMDDDVVRNHPS